MSLWWLKLSVFLGLLGETTWWKKNLLFCSNISIFQEGGGSYSKDYKEPFFCVGLNIFKENGEGWQKPNFSQYEIDLK